MNREEINKIIDNQGVYEVTYKDYLIHIEKIEWDMKYENCISCYCYEWRKDTTLNIEKIESCKEYWTNILSVDDITPRTGLYIIVTGQWWIRDGDELFWLEEGESFRTYFEHYYADPIAYHYIDLPFEKWQPYNEAIEKENFVDYLYFVANNLEKEKLNNRRQVTIGNNLYSLDLPIAYSEGYYIEAQEGALVYKYLPLHDGGSRSILYHQKVLPKIHTQHEAICSKPKSRLIKYYSIYNKIMEEYKAAEVNVQRKMSPMQKCDLLQRLYGIQEDALAYIELYEKIVANNKVLLRKLKNSQKLYSAYTLYYNIFNLNWDPQAGCTTMAQSILDLQIELIQITDKISLNENSEIIKKYIDALTKATNKYRRKLCRGATS